MQRGLCHGSQSFLRRPECDSYNNHAEPIKSEHELFFQFHIVSLDFLTRVHAYNLLERCPNIWIFVDQRQVLGLGPHNSSTSHPLPYVLGCCHDANVYLFHAHAIMKDDTLLVWQMENGEWKGLNVKLFQSKNTSHVILNK